MSDADRLPAEAIAEAAWRHLVNRHDLAQALADTAATRTLDSRLLLAVERLRSTPTPQHCAPTGGPHNP